MFFVLFATKHRMLKPRGYRIKRGEIMNKYYMTADSRNIIEVNGNKIAVIKNGSKIMKDLPFADFEICGIGNNGNIAVKTTGGVFVDSVSGDKKPYFIEAFSPGILNENNSKLGSAKLNNKGNMVCAEKINYRNNFIDNLVNKFKKDESAPKLINHQFVIYNLSDSNMRTAFILPMGGKENNKIRWSISPNFKYMVVVEEVRDKKNEMLYIVNLAVGTILAKIEISSTTAKNLSINNFGVCIFEVNGGLKEYVIITSNGKVMRFKKDIATKLMHFGNKIIVFKSTNRPHLVIKDMDEKIICEANLAPLEKMNIDYNVYFNEKDDIDLIVSQDNKIKVLHCHLENFHYDLKRWELLAREKTDNGNGNKEKLKSMVEDMSAAINNDGFKVDYEDLSKSLYKSLMEKMEN